jgi:Cu+-exporting ATPase
MEKDPVCGMLVDPKQAAGQRVYQGKTYYFCSPACLVKFGKAPARYVEGKKPDSPKERF